ncbi:MAG: CAP domain-containing protein [Planctomycetota bacterium]|nr:CAP domain-containing protein [Planctomycetota bacterium]
MNRYLLCAVLACASASARGEEPPADLDALLAKAKSNDAAERAEAFAALRKAGPTAAAKLAVMLDPLQRNAIVNLTRMLASPQARAAAQKQTAALDAARKAALALVFDEAKYPDGAAKGTGQAEVDAALAAVEAAWQARRDGVLASAPGLAEAWSRAQEQAAVLAALARPQAGGLPRCFELDAIFERVAEPEMLAAWPVLAQNRFGPSPAAAAERAVLAEVNAYRIRLGLPVLRFDERLYRAAQWFAQESFEKKLFGHFCDVPGKKDPVERAEFFGHKKCVGENVAYNGMHVMDWLHSAPHHRVLADKQSVEGAVAIRDHVAVLMTGAADPPAKLDPVAAASAADRSLWEDMARAVGREPGGSRLRGLERLARYLTGLGQKKPAAEVYREITRLAPAHAEARAALGDLQVDGRWAPSDEKGREKRTGWPTRIKAWSTALLGQDEAAKRKALEEAAAAGATELTALIDTLGDPAKTADRETLRAALLAAARLAIPGAEARALELLKSNDPHERWIAVDVMETCGGAASIEAAVEGLTVQPGDFHLIRCIETMTGRLVGIHAGDEQPARAEKVKAFKAWWDGVRAGY